MSRLQARLGESLLALRGVFANAALRRLQLAYAGSSVGNFAYGVAISVYAYEHGGATAVGVVSAIRLATAASIAPFAALLADRFPRERVMLGSGLARLATVGATAFAVAADAPALPVYAIATLTTVLGTVFRPAEAALIPLLARSPEELTAANVSSSSFDSLGVFAGPSIAAFLLAIGGPSLAFGFVAGTFAWSSFFVARVRTPENAAPSADHVSDDGLRGLVGGFRAIAHEPRLRLLIGLYGAQCFVAGALGVLVVALALDTLDLGSAGVGLLQAACGVGALVGAAIALWLVGRARVAADFGVGLALWGLPLLVVGALPSVAVAAVGLAVVGIGNTLVDISAMTLLQRTAPANVAGRVFGCLESMIVASLALGALVAPALIALVGVRGALLAVGGVLPALAVVRLRALNRIDEGSHVPEDRLAAVRAVPFLAPLPLQTLEFLGERLADVDVQAGATLFRRGDEGDRFYLLKDGTLTVDLLSETRLLRAPSFVGEIALLRDVPRTATVRSETGATLWALEREDFLNAVTGHRRSSASANELVLARIGAGGVN